MQRRAVDNRTVEQKATVSLLGAPPPRSSVPHVTPVAEARRQRHLRSHSNLAEAAGWLQELVEPAAGGSAAPAKDRAPLRAALAAHRSSASEAMEADAQAHARALAQVRGGAKRLAEDLRSLKRAATPEEVEAARSTRESAHRTVRLRPLAPCITRAVDNTCSPPPSSGQLQL
jgi:hypothetical protein